MPTLKWPVMTQTVPTGARKGDQPPPAFRAPVPGGWLVYVATSQDMVGSVFGATFVPAPEHNWPLDGDDLDERWREKRRRNG